MSLYFTSLCLFGFVENKIVMLSKTFSEANKKMLKYVIGEPTGKAQERVIFEIKVI